MLQRVQLMLDSQTKKELKRIAELENRSMSQIARETIRKGLQKKKNKAKDSGVKALIEWSKKAVKGPGNAEYDKYAYDF